MMTLRLGSLSSRHMRHAYGLHLFTGTHAPLSLEDSIVAEMKDVVRASEDFFLVADEGLCCAPDPNISPSQDYVHAIRELIDSALFPQVPSSKALKRHGESRLLKPCNLTSHRHGGSASGH